MWMSSREHANALNSSYDFIASPPKRDWLLYVARHKVRHTDLGCAPLFGHPGPGISVCGSNPQQLSVSAGSRIRRVVPWGTVSSWSRSLMNLHTATTDIHHTGLRKGCTLRYAIDRNRGIRVQTVLKKQNALKRITSKLGNFRKVDAGLKPLQPAVGLSSEINSELMVAGSIAKSIILTVDIAFYNPKLIK